jgi:hypothetical protein
MPKECYQELIDKAFPSEIQAGKQWYKDRNLEVHKLSAETGYSPEQCAGVIAVLSPMVEWSLNIKYTRNFLKFKGKWKGPGFNINRKKALSILKGNLEVIRGPKVTAFYKTLLNPEHIIPTIDTQMIAAFWKGIAYRDDYKVVQQSDKRLEPIRQAVVEIAKENNWKVSECQAIIWIVFKRVNGKYADQLKLWN